MSLVWNKLKPADKYLVHSPHDLSMYQSNFLYQAYQPLMGARALALYFSLFSEVEAEQQASPEKRHLSLMKTMGLDLDQIYEARLSLEALGLLKTFLYEIDEEKIFEYILSSPLSPEQFFEDDILSITLYNKLGAKHYRDVRARYASAVPTYLESGQKKEVTKAFHEVFQAIQPSEWMTKSGSEQATQLSQIHQEFPLHYSATSEQGVQLDSYDLDLESLKGMFAKGIDAESILTPKNVRELKKIAYFYQLDMWSLSRLIQDALDGDDQLDISLLREKAKQWYRQSHGGKPPHIRQITQPLAQRLYEQQRELTEEEKHLQRLERTSPLELLEAYQGGGKVAEGDLRLLDELIFEYQLYPAVINVLLEYVLLTNEYKLPKNLVTKIAAHWKRLKLENVKQAQELAKKEHQQYKEWQNKKNQPIQKTKAPANRFVGKEVRRDVLPEWIMQQEEGGPLPEETKPSFTAQEKRERMEKLLKELGERDGT